MEWKAQSVRFTAFSPAFVAGRGTFRKVVGVEPDSANERPREGLLTETGVQTGRLITVTFLPGRAQLDLQVPEAQEAPFAVFASGYQAVFRDSLALARTWLEALPTSGAVVRLAFGSALICDQPNRASAYTALGPLLPALSIDSNVSDLLYRINRPRTSKAVNALTLNRLSTWQVVEWQQMVVSSHSRTHSGFVTLATAARLELDLNTDALRTEALPEEALGTILTELVDQGSEIASEGDRP